MQSQIGNIHSYWKSGLLIIAALVLALLAMPALGLVALASRFLLPLLILVFLALLLIPSFRKWLGFDQVAAQQSGLFLPRGVMLHPQHSWARFDRRRNVYRVGPDDLIPKVLGRVDTVTLPIPGTRYRQGDPLFELSSQGRRIVVRSPISGTVIETNSKLASEPSALHDNPYETGWVADLWPSASRSERANLYRRKRAKTFFRGEVDRLMARLLPSVSGDNTMPDGGELADDVHLQIDDENWRALVESFFGGTY